MATPGMLYVTMQPKPGLSLDQFHEWYNNEHGPTRLRLPEIFPNGLRYQAIDSAEPAFLAIYDVTSMSHLTTPTYTTLRENRSAREAETIGQVDVCRSFLDLVLSRKSPNFVPPENLTDEEALGTQLVSVSITPADAEGAEKEILKWWEEEHAEMISKIPGWLRSRVYRTSTLEGSGKAKLVALNEFSKDNGLGGPEHKASKETPWAQEVFSKSFADMGVRTYSLFYIFGPAPRDLHHLSRLPDTKSFSTVDSKTKTITGSSASIDSFVTTSDGLVLPYRLEGNPSPSAPTVALSNSLLTSMHMWDAFVAILKAERPDLRILRYDTRGRHAGTPATPATLTMLADDIDTLLTALRIPKLHALIGVSMGGATTLQFVLLHGSRVSRFVACDCNATSSAANTAAWKERIATAESTSEDGSPGIRKLAGVTVERWFHPSTMSDKKELAQAMTDMVAANDVEGFKYSCQALWDYDLKGNLGACQVPGILVVGDGDGKGALVKAMDGFKGLVGKEGAELRVVPNTGHLPMFEDAAAFWASIKSFV
ncbi:uncharacterized protein PgNI_01653 [Pyricularia grisea]|uniref:AB hydrolase-1 domain-containing protein n=1 Tax=Pyricularia grisea TaxID=148305 RepID=A0A6P8BJZ4_PYRGI|nr:uncharacterized protein PgNI_01653 [Pyricularia grisea]TLD17009.1 hypothetical protein PgNI_01653 [Pyricularia grisea]